MSSKPEMVWSRVLIRPSAQFNEIMPTIYSRFMEKEAREWRQIYKVRWYCHTSCFFTNK